MNELIVKFINAYNEYIKAWNENFEDPVSKERYRPFILNPKLDLSSDSLLLQIIDNYDFNTSACISSLMFYPSPMQNDIHENWIAFGEYVGYDLILVLDSNSKEILAIDVETNEIDWYCAKNEESLLLAFIEVFKVKMLYPKNQEVSEYMLSETLQKCINLAGGEKYSTYYKHVLGYGI